MPSFDYYATFEESIEILQDLCVQGFQIIPEPSLFDEPRAPSFDSVTDGLVQLLKVGPSFYLAGAFTRFPIQFSHLKTGPSAGKYAVNLLAQGPLMQASVGRISIVGGVQRLLPGDISYQDAYRNPETGHWEKPSPELKAAYRRAVSAIKKRVVRCLAGIPIFIGPAALALFERGEAHINDPRIVVPLRG